MINRQSSSNQGPIDLSTAPSSSSYYNSQQQPLQHQQYSSQLWGRPNASTAQQNNFQQQSRLNFYNNQNSNNNSSNNDSNCSSKERELEILKIDLKIKESQIESLENEIQRLNESLLSVEKPDSTSALEIPKTVEDVFTRLANNNEALSKELDDTKERLESLVLAISMNPTNSTLPNGRYDELEISHKIILKLESLVKENESLLKNLSFGKSKEYEIELNLLKQKNQELEQELSKYK